MAEEGEIVDDELEPVEPSRGVGGVVAAVALSTGRALQGLVGNAAGDVGGSSLGTKVTPEPALESVLGSVAVPELGAQPESELE